MLATVLPSTSVPAPVLIRLPAVPVRPQQCRQGEAAGNLLIQGVLKSAATTFASELEADLWWELVWCVCIFF